jgi:hypothetical protein
MKTNSEIVNSINKKLNEAKKEFEQATNELTSLKKDNNIETAQKFMVLKDKTMFFKTLILVYDDLLKEINNV